MNIYIREFGEYKILMHLILYFLPLNIIIPAILVIIILTVLEKFRLAKSRLTKKRKIIIAMIIGILFSSIIFFWKSFFVTSKITDFGKPCIDSVMCQGKCWTSDVYPLIRDKVKRFGIFTVGACGDSPFIFGCSSEINWGIKKLSICIDPVKF